jgi:hypothetical protein
MFGNKLPTKKLMLGGSPIQETKKLKLLGVTFQTRNSLMAHCTEKGQKARQRTNLLKKMRGTDWGCSKKTLLHLYKSYIRPVLETGSICTALANKSSLNKLQVAENMALRCATRLYGRISSEELHRSANIQPLHERLQNLRDNAKTRFGNSKIIKILHTRSRTLLRTRKKR